MPASIRVRALAADELDVLEPLWLELHHHHRATVTAVPIVGDDGLSWSRRRAWYVSMLASDAAFMIVAEAGDTPIGYAFTRIREGPDDTLDLGTRWAQLITLSVRSEFRSQGVGSMLMDALDDALATIGIDDIEVDVMQGNARAQHFYERRGFAVGQIYLYKVSDRNRS